MQSDQKTLNQMNRLGDMLHFPAAVNAGASLNIVITIAITWQIASRWPAWVGPWVALVLAVNLLPVVLLRLTLSADTIYPTLSGMNFFRDQHKFSDWVYVAASANMAFWILLTWTLVRLYPAPVVFIPLEMVALLVTFSPVLFRRFLGD